MMRRASLALACFAAALSGAPEAGAIPPGERDVKVVITKFADQANYPYTVAQATNAVFDGPAGNANGYLQGVTGGATSLTGAANVEQLSSTLNRAQVSTCNDLFDVLDDVLGQLPGNPLGDHEHVMVVAPRVESCSGSGVAGIGPPGGAGQAGLNWIYLNGRMMFNGQSNWRLVAHELTHNLGANHAGACAPSFPAQPCNGNDYGDPFAIMGASTGALAGFPSSWQQARIGVLDPGADVATVAADGTYELTAANDTGAVGTKLLMVPRGGGGKPFYALETRGRVAYDDFLSADARLYNGVSVRLAVGLDAPYDPGTANDTQLVPAHPAPNERQWPLLPCEAYVDAGAGVSIRPLSASGGITHVQIALGGRPLPDDPTCGAAGEARLTLNAKPKSRRVRSGRVAKFKLRARNRGDLAAQGVRVCVNAPRRLKVAGKRCKSAVSIPGGAVRTKVLKVKATRRASGRRFKIKFTARAQGTRAAARARLKVR